MLGILKKCTKGGSRLLNIVQMITRQSYKQLRIKTKMNANTRVESKKNFFLINFLSHFINNAIR